ncbi:alpha/beta fold hydrolase [Cupriavidus pinatubonensis]|uniref:alpha/beta hydrolase n=1 Tax=Cupriavidus pinatubonensis TaxID=248026 RepID=UPI001C72CA52|nr:alpha/beta fold hydrolase [Cupriavidus pinatubonensis]QYY27801.1 alpha/beta fold hydrolase [Cupriavidus pinatubonensis]
MALQSGSGKMFVAGEAGRIELIVDMPRAVASGIAVVAHPHPLQGGTATHKVPHVLAKALAARGYVTVRPNFRGVGETEGEHDAGDGETNDTVAVVNHLRQQYPGLPLVLAGFSFGAYVVALTVQVLASQGLACPHVILTGMPWGTIPGHRSYATPDVPSTALVVHGENDERVTLGAVLDWARPQEMPIVVVPGANHFFTGKLSALERVVGRYLDHLPEPSAPA